ncbi:unnamed protein product [Echinostoma caproni]|uniref:SAC3/GANP/THP3 conserved domain-containing protein n=1 Tax=Echinostoma caproni TaxID=27848 RepID=A0A3P8IF21_9TREM|nr:unnamed protein product [Echinostoma caproni]
MGTLRSRSPMRHRPIQLSVVQGIEDEFAVAVYESHADAALEAGDFEEFHQCQSQLLRLYKEGAPSSRLLEFTAYRLLYYMFTLDLLGINTIMAGLRPTHKSNPCIRFALELRSAWSLNNYQRFFRLPPMRCAQVVHWFLDRERKEAVKTYLKVFPIEYEFQSFRQSILEFFLHVTDTFHGVIEKCSVLSVLLLRSPPIF